MNIYSKNNRWRARLSETDDGVVNVAFDQFSGVRDTRGINVSLLDPADIPKDAMWKQVSAGEINDRPFHVVRDYVSRFLETL